MLPRSQLVSQLAPTPHITFTISPQAVANGLLHASLACSSARSLHVNSSSWRCHTSLRSLTPTYMSHISHTSVAGPLAILTHHHRRAWSPDCHVCHMSHGIAWLSKGLARDDAFFLLSLISVRGNVDVYFLYLCASVCVLVIAFCCRAPSGRCSMCLL